MVGKVVATAPDATANTGLAILPQGRHLILVGIGGGEIQLSVPATNANLLLIREAGAVVTGARSTDEAVAALPSVLRGVACAGGSYGVVGYSTLLGRLVGWEFSYCANYAARMTITWARALLVDRT